MTIDDEMLMAYADGELDPLRARRVEAAVEADPALGLKIDAHRRLKQQLSTHYAPVADEAVPERLRALFPADNVVAFERPAPRRWRPVWAQAAAIAATLVVGLSVGQRLDTSSAGPVETRDGVVVASAAVAKALDTRLASAPVEGGVRIGLTFRNREGAVCRSFAGEGLSGLACRDDGAWAVRQLSSGGSNRATDYRQASTADPATLAALDGMIAGEPFDAGQERAAQLNGWR